MADFERDIAVAADSSLKAIIANSPQDRQTFGGFLPEFNKAKKGKERIVSAEVTAAFEDVVKDDDLSDEAFEIVIGAANSGGNLYDYVSSLEGGLTAQRAAQVIYGLRYLHTMTGGGEEVWKDLSPEAQNIVGERVGVVKKTAEKVLDESNIAEAIQSALGSARGGGGESDGVTALRDPRYEGSTFFKTIERTYGEVSGFHDQTDNPEQRVKKIEQISLWFFMNPLTRNFLEGLLTEAGSKFERSTPLDNMIKGLVTTRNLIEAFSKTYRGSQEEMEQFAGGAISPEEHDALMNNAVAEIKYLMRDGREIVMKPSVEGEYAFISGDEAEPLKLEDLEVKEIVDLLKDERYQRLIKEEYTYQKEVLDANVPGGKKMVTESINPVRVLYKYLRIRDFGRANGARVDIATNKNFEKLGLFSGERVGHKRKGGILKEQLTDVEQKFVDQILLQPLVKSKTQDHQLYSNDKNNPEVIKAGEYLIGKFAKGESKTRINEDVTANYVYSDFDDPMRLGRVLEGDDWGTKDRVSFADSASSGYIGKLYKRHKIVPEDVVAIGLPRFDDGRAHRMLIKVGSQFAASGEYAVSDGYLELGLLSNSKVAEVGLSPFSVAYEVYVDQYGQPIFDSANEPILKPLKDENGRALVQRGKYRVDANGKRIENPEGAHKQDFVFKWEQVVSYEVTETNDEGQEVGVVKEIKLKDIKFKREDSGIEGVDGALVIENNFPVLVGDFPFQATDFVFNRNRDGSLSLDSSGNVVVLRLNKDHAEGLSLRSQVKTDDVGNPELVGRYKRVEWKKKNGILEKNAAGEPMPEIEYLEIPVLGADGKPMYQPLKEMVDEKGNFKVVEGSTTANIKIMSDNILAATLAPFHKTVLMLKMLDATLPEHDIGNRGNVLPKGLLKGINFWNYMLYFNVVQPYAGDGLKHALSSMVAKERNNHVMMQILNEELGHRPVRFMNPHLFTGQDVLLEPVKWSSEPKDLKQKRKEINELILLWKNEVRADLLNDKSFNLLNTFEQDEFVRGKVQERLKKSSHWKDLYGDVDGKIPAGYQGSGEWIQLVPGGKVYSAEEYSRMSIMDGCFSEFSLISTVSERHYIVNLIDGAAQQAWNDRTREFGLPSEANVVRNELISKTFSKEQIQKYFVEKKISGEPLATRYEIKKKYQVNARGKKLREKMAEIDQLVNKKYEKVTELVDGDVMRRARELQNMVLEYKEGDVVGEGRWLSRAEHLQLVTNMESRVARVWNKHNFEDTLESLGVDVANTPDVFKTGRLGYQNLVVRGMRPAGLYIGDKRDVFSGYWDYVGRHAALESLKVSLLTKSVQSIDPSTLTRLGLDIKKYNEFHEAVFTLVEEWRRAGTITNEIAQKYYPAMVEVLAQIGNGMGWKNAVTNRSAVIDFATFLIDLVVPYDAQFLYQEVTPDKELIPFTTDSDYQRISPKGGNRVGFEYEKLANGTPGYERVVDNVGRRTKLLRLVYPNREKPNSPKPYVTTSALELANKIHNSGYDKLTKHLKLPGRKKIDVQQPYYPLSLKKSEEEQVQDLVDFFSEAMLDSQVFDTVAANSFALQFGAESVTASRRPWRDRLRALAA